MQLASLNEEEQKAEAEIVLRSKALSMLVSASENIGNNNDNNINNRSNNNK